MLRQDNPEIVEIKIPREFLQTSAHLLSKENKLQEALELLLSEEISLNWIEKTILHIEASQLTSYIIVVEDNKTLNLTETIMLQAFQHYIDEYFTNLKAAQKNQQAVCSPSASAAAAACTTAATETTAAKAALPDITAAPVKAALPEVTAPVKAVLPEVTAPAKVALPDTIALTSAGDANVNTRPAAATTAESTPRRQPTNAEYINNAALITIQILLQLDTWQQKGRGLFTASYPEGISKMKKLNNPTFDDFYRIAFEMNKKISLTRTNMTSRFYKMIVDLKKIEDINASINHMESYAKNELRVDYSNHTKKGAVALSENDRKRLCGIANVEPTGIEALASSSSATATAAAAAPQTGLRP